MTRGYPFYVVGRWDGPVFTAVFDDRAQDGMSMMCLFSSKRKALKSCAEANRELPPYGYGVFPLTSNFSSVVSSNPIARR